MEKESPVMLSEILNNSSFKARELMTKKAKWLYLDKFDDKNLREKAFEEARDKKIDNLPVCRDYIPVGYVKVPEPGTNFSGIDEELVSIKEMDKIEENDSISKLVTKFISGFDSQKLYFVSKGAEITGLINHSDLNRKSVYIYLYTRLVAMEQGIRKQIKQAYEGYQEREIFLSLFNFFGERRRRQLVNEIHEEALVSLLFLPEMIKIIQSDVKLRVFHSHYGQGLLTVANKVRIRIAHPTKLLIPGRTALKELLNIKEFLEGADSIIIDNEKNR